MAIYDVGTFGAKGDGRTDDTAAIQAAIDAAAEYGGGEIYLAAGTYLVSPSGTLQGNCLVLKEGTSLSGDGIGQTVIKLADDSTGATTVVRAGGDFTGVSRLSIDGNSARNAGTVDGWVSGDSDDISLKAVEVFGASGHGFDLRNDIQQFTLGNVVARFNGGDGIIADGQSNSIISDSTALGNGGNGFNLGGDLRVLDSEATGNSRDGFILLEGHTWNIDGSNMLVDGGSASNNGGMGVRVEGVDGFLVSGMEVVGNTDYGIGSDASRNGEISLNRVHDNSTDIFSSVEINLDGWIGEPTRIGQGVTATHNLVSGGSTSYYGIIEPFDAGDYNRIVDNIVSGTPYPVGVNGEHSVVRDNGTFVAQYGTVRADRLSGSFAADHLYGGAGNDRIDAGAGDDVVYAGAGRDRLTGGVGADTFHFGALTDSFRDATRSHADRIVDFDLSTDRIDVSALGLSAVGNGHGDTLRVVYDAARDLTYLKQLDADAQGQRFEVVLEGDRSAFSSGNFALSGDIPMPPAAAFGSTPRTVPDWLDANRFGTARADTLSGDSADNTLRGGDGNDRLRGGVGDDILVGGGGADAMNGDSGNDTFVYTRSSDSFRQPHGVFADSISGFSVYDDRIDVSSMGYSGLGDGHGGTLKLTQDSGRTFLRDLDADALGRLFEIRLIGEYAATFTADNVLFGDTGPVELLGPSDSHPAA